MGIKIEIQHKEDGRFIANVPELPGAMAYGPTARVAVAKAEALALRFVAERLEHGEAIPDDFVSVFSKPSSL